jgi:hypothetical protein
MGRGSLFFLLKTQRMNVEVYKQVLQIHGSKLFFLLDGALCRTSKKVMVFLREKKESFSILDSPGNSPVKPN